jgi:hypothetical protein
MDGAMPKGAAGSTDQQKLSADSQMGRCVGGSLTGPTVTGIRFATRTLSPSMLYRCRLRRRRKALMLEDNDLLAFFFLCVTACIITGILSQ